MRWRPGLAAAAVVGLSCLLAVGPAVGADRAAPRGEDQRAHATATAPATQEAQPAVNPRCYFTTDDGKTFFAGPRRVTPAALGERTLVQAIIFEDAGHRKFVGYLLRVSNAHRHEAEAAIKAGKELELGWVEVKRPGEKEWVPLLGKDGQVSPAAAKVATVKSADGTAAVPVEPGEEGKR